MPGDDGPGNPYITLAVAPGVVLAYGLIALLFSVFGHGYYPPSN